MNVAKKIFVMLLIFIALTIFTLYHSTSSSLSPSDLVKLERVKNVVVKGMIENVTRDDVYTIFYISDGVSKVKAIYKGDVTSSEVIATGDWENGVFYVKEVLSKCHTEYGG